MSTKNNLKIKIESFSKLKENWGGYNENEITSQSIITAHKVIDTLSDIKDVNVFPMRDGGIQIDIGDFKEIEIFNQNVTEINFDSDFNINNKITYELR